MLEQTKSNLRSHSTELEHSVAEVRQPLQVALTLRHATLMQTLMKMMVLARSPLQPTWIAKATV